MVSTDPDIALQAPAHDPTPSADANSDHDDSIAGSDYDPDEELGLAYYWVKQSEFEAAIRLGMCAAIDEKIVKLLEAIMRQSSASNFRVKDEGIEVTKKMSADQYQMYDDFCKTNKAQLELNIAEARVSKEIQAKRDQMWARWQDRKYLRGGTYDKLDRVSFFTVLNYLSHAVRGPGQEHTGSAKEEMERQHQN